MSGRTVGRALRTAVPRLVAVAAVVGVGAGVARGWQDAAAGFPMMMLHTVRVELDWALAGALVFLALYALLGPMVRVRLGVRWATALAAAVALAPAVAAAGYRLNRAYGIRPSELFEPYPLRLNLLLVAGCAAVWVVLTILLVRAERRGDGGASGGGEAPGGETGWKPAVAGAVAAALVLAAVHGAAWRAFSGPPHSAEGRADVPDVLLILVDALRADHVSASGYERETTPAIDSLAADGVLFREAISQSTFTKASIASLFTGRYPYQHGVYWGSRTEDPEFPGAITSDVLPPGEWTLAEAMRDRGLYTAAWVHNSHLREFMGFGQGFATYHDQAGDAARINRLFTEWLAGPGRRYRTFTYLHYIDLHDPYLPEAPYDSLFGTFPDPYEGIDLAEWGAHLEAVREGRTVPSSEQVAAYRAYYDGQLRAVDDELARLLETLEASGRYDDMLIVLTSDHGDAFMEHGAISHSTTPYEELVRVPLIVKLPGSLHAGETVDAQVRLVDVLPTLLELIDPRARRRSGEPAGQPPRELAGCSLVPLLDGGSDRLRDEGCRTALIEIAEAGEEPTVAVRTARWKYIRRGDGGEELYDLAADPGERSDLAPVEEGDPVRLRDLALEAVAARAEAVDRIELDPETVRRLKALGYVE